MPQEDQEKNKVLDNEKDMEPEELFDVEINSFIDHISSLEKTIDISLNAINEKFSDSVSNFEDFIEDNLRIIEKEGNKEFLIRYDKIRQFKDIRYETSAYALAHKIIPRSYLISLISQFDAYLGRLLRVIFLVKPEILNGCERNFTFYQLTEFETIEAAREYVLEKQIENILRKSHRDQFKWMEQNFGIKLTKDLDIWSSFIEVTERRNLFVHNGGIVSSQYLKVCLENNVSLPDLKIGDELHVSRDYFLNAYKVIYEIGFKLAHVLWRKYVPKHLERADQNLIDHGYDLLYKEDYFLTKKIFDFSVLVLPKHSSEIVKKIMIINRALGYKWDGEDKIAKEIIRAEDWTACQDKFRLAAAIILDFNKKAYSIMKKIGNNENEITKSSYREWPLFKKIRNEDTFINLFEEIFQEPYNLVDSGDLKEPDAL